MFENILRLCLTNQSEPLQIARAAISCNATVVVLDDNGAKWMRSQGVPTITIKKLDSEEFAPDRYAKDAPIMLTTMAFHAIGEHGQYLQKTVDQLRIQLAREEDRHKATKDDLTKRAQIMEANRDAAKFSLDRANARIGELTKGNTALLQELIQARRPWWKKWLGKGVCIMAMGVLFAGCNASTPKKQGTNPSANLVFYEGCTYIQSKSDHYMFHSATCANPKHGGVLKCN